MFLVTSALHLSHQNKYALYNAYFCSNVMYSNHSQDQSTAIPMSQRLRCRWLLLRMTLLWSAHFLSRRWMDAFISWNIMTVSIDFHGRRVGDKGVQISFVSSLQELECPQPVNHSLSQNWPRHSMWYIEIITFMKHTSLTLEHSQVIQNYIGYRGLVFLCLLMPENLEIIRKLLLKRHLPGDAHSCIHGFPEPRAMTVIMKL